MKSRITKRFARLVRSVSFLVTVIAISGTAIASDEDFTARLNVRDAIAILSDAPAHGITTTETMVENLHDLLLQSRSGLLESNEVDAYVANAVLRYALDFAVGSRRPRPDEVVSLHADIAAALTERRLIDWYKQQIPVDPAYHRLRATYVALAASTSHSDEWPTIGGWRTLEVGSEGPRVALLRQRLELPVAEPARYDDDVRDAVTRYQLLHGLDVDGKVGRRTLAHLDTGFDARMAQIRSNLERHRSEWRDSSRRYGIRVVVNLPSYRLTLQDNHTTVTSMKVIIGHPDTPTPLLDEPVERLVFSPYWYVPDKIAREEILPAMLRNPGYGASNNYEVLDRRTHQPLTADDWQGDQARSLVIRQQPGDNNALGRVKFVLPNDRAVYLHDTRAPELFAKSRRALSHGCIRVEKPALLASLLLRANEGWSDEAIGNAMQRTLPKSVRPVVKADVVATYFTAETFPDGKTAFYEDIYGRDAGNDARMASSYIHPLPSIGDTLLASLP